MKRYRRVPVEVEATQLPPLSADGGADTWQEIASWCGGQVILSSQGGQRMHLTTVLGRMYAEAGDWIVRAAEGEFRALSAEGFARDYSPSMMTQPDGDIRPLRRQSYQRPGPRAATLCTREGRP